MSIELAETFTAAVSALQSIGFAASEPERVFYALLKVKAGQEAIGAEHAVPLVLGPITLVRPSTLRHPAAS